MSESPLPLERVRVRPVFVIVIVIVIVHAQRVLSLQPLVAIFIPLRTPYNTGNENFVRKY